MNQKRICTIDIIKFFLSIVIVLHHYQQIMNIRFDKWNFYGGAIYFGYAVEFFFLISGFLSAYCLKSEEISNFKRYILKKAVRIYPMTMISVLFTTGLMFMYKMYKGSWFLDIKPGLWMIFNSILLTHSGGVLPDLGLVINNPTWYLCILMICYVLYWQIMWVCSRLKVYPYYWFAAVCMIGIGLIKYQINLPYLNIYSGRGYAAFFFGIVIWYAYQNIESLKLFAASAAVLVISGIILAVGATELFDDQWAILTFLIFPSILLTALYLDLLFRNNIWRILGGISFEMYLWHFPLLIIWSFIPNYSLYNQRIMMLVFTVITILIGVLIYHFIEIPITRFLRKNIEFEYKC